MSYLFGKLCDQGISWHWKNDVRSWFKAARNFFFTPDSNRTLIWHCLLRASQSNTWEAWETVWKLCCLGLHLVVEGWDQSSSEFWGRTWRRRTWWSWRSLGWPTSKETSPNGSTQSGSQFKPCQSSRPLAAVQFGLLVFVLPYWKSSTNKWLFKTWRRLSNISSRSSLECL